VEREAQRHELTLCRGFQCLTLCYLLMCGAKRGEFGDTEKDGMRYLPDRPIVEEVLQAFQGAVLAFLVTGDREPGGRTVMRILENKEKARSHA
jgi:hypothetical protein